MIFLLYIPNRFLRYVERCVCAPWRKCLINSIVQSRQYNKGRRRFWPSLSRSGERNVIFIRNSFGGITDWFKGMVSLFDFCEANGYGFKIYAKEKFDFRKYYQPDQYDWTLEDGEYDRMNKGKGSYHIWLSQSGVSGSEVWFEQQDAMKFLFRRCGITNLFVHQCAAYGLPAFGKRFRQLFSMSEYLGRIVRKEYDRMYPYISVSFRFVSLLNDSDECVEGIDSISSERQQGLISKCIEELSNIHKDNVGCNVLVTTDSSTFLAALDMKRPDSCWGGDALYYLKGDKIHHHIGFSESVTELGITKSYAEFMLISMASKAFQVKDDLMYESKFPKWAATINSVPYSIIEIR